MDYLTTLFDRNAPLATFGLVSLICALICLLLMQVTTSQVLGINAWIKPAKFYLSTTIFVWTMAWIMAYLPQQGVVTIYSWTVIAILAFELAYISWSAGVGQLSHFDISEPFKAAMFGLMGTAIGIMTIFTLFIGLMFFQGGFPELPTAYLWGIRLGILCFVIFAMEGYVMGANLAHTVGAPDGGAGLKFLNWSVTHGDLRIAHFVGMHGLQILPLAGYYLFSDTRWLLTLAAGYFLLASLTLWLALRGIPLLKV